MREDSHISQKLAEEYWIKKLEGVTIDSDLLRPSAEAGGARFEPLFAEVFSPELSGALSALFQGPKAEDNLFLFLLSAFQAIVARYSRNPDILVAVPVEGNVVYIRLQVSQDATFRQLLQTVQQTYIDAIGHNSFDRQTLARRLEANKTADIQALDAIVFYYSPFQSPPAADIAGALQACVVKRETGELALEISGNPERTDKSIIAFFAEAYIEALALFQRQRTIPLKELDLLPPYEAELALGKFPYSRRPLIIDKTVVALFEENVERAPDKTAVVCADHHLTYIELNRRVNRLAHYLAAQGIGRDSLAAMLLERSLDMIIAALAILKAGGAYVPIDTSYPQKRIISILNESGVDIVISDQSVGGQLDFTSLVNIREGLAAPVSAPPRPQIADFDSLPIPDRTLIDYSRYHRHIGMSKARHTIALQATRGCPYNCIYCHKIWPKNNVHRSAENIFREIANCYECGIRRFVFIDDIFNLNVKNSGRLLQTIIKEGLDINLYFPHGLRGDILTEEFIDLLVAAGTVNIAIALETTSPRIQRLMRKNLDIDRYLKTPAGDAHHADIARVSHRNRSRSPGDAGHDDERPLAAFLRFEYSEDLPQFRDV